MRERTYGKGEARSDILSMLTPTPEAIVQAKLNPNGFVLVVDGYDGPSEKVPPERVRGAWKVNEDGIIMGDFIPNPKYRPIESCN